MKSIKLLIYGGQGGLEEFIEKEEDIKAIGVTGNEMDLLDFNHTSSVMPDVILIDARSSGREVWTGSHANPKGKTSIHSFSYFY
ncbi:hypothetical protein [Peribacillus simplex]|uniref:Uncharacterized protein n=1 Tax=Peribacillus simplex TaxID=1478 RepID=A0A9W4PAH2_9BACI|nr:hypothetical protein [Peribacillus simplex]CAH0160067.1 hypothetical protein SRABI133_00925 [Peribacillus simplex]